MYVICHLFLLNGLGFCQNFEGKILYNITYQDSIHIKDGIFYRQNFPNQLEYIFGGTFFKTTWIRFLEKNTTIICDFDKNKKYSYGLRIEGVKKEPLLSLDYSEYYHITNTSEQEIILGYSCDKYLLESKTGVPGPPKKGYIWVTQEINFEKYRTEVDFLGNFQASKYIGFPLKVVVEGEDFPNVWSVITFQVNKIERGKSNLNKFDLLKFYNYKNKPTPLERVLLG